MKKHLLNLVIIVMVINSLVFAQIPDFHCSVVPVKKGALESQVGGKYKPSSNAPGQYFRILFVFVQFSGDNRNFSDWTYGQLPTYHNKIVDSLAASTYRAFTLSDYWKTMSLGNFDVIGDVYPNVVTLRSENWYLTNNKNFEDANKDVLDSINGKIDFKRYDNWGLNPTT